MKTVDLRNIVIGPAMNQNEPLVLEPSIEELEKVMAPYVMSAGPDRAR